MNQIISFQYLYSSKIRIFCSGVISDEMTPRIFTILQSVVELPDYEERIESLISQTGSQINEMALKSILNAIIKNRTREASVIYRADSSTIYFDLAFI